MKSIVLIAVACAITSTAYGSGHKRITFDQAEALALVAAAGKEIPRPSAFTPKDNGVSDQQINSKRFITFEIIYPDSFGTSPYTVDFYTGDVFSLSDRAWGGCGIDPPNKPLPEIKTKELRMVQKEVRRTIHLTWVEYQKLKTKKPRCRDR